MNWRTRARAALRRLHFWLALTACLPLIVLAVTGSLLIFPQQMNTWTTGVPNRVPPTGNRLSYAELVQHLDAALEDSDQATRLVFGPTTDHVVTASSIEGFSLAIDPFRGDVLRADKSKSLMDVVLWLHVTLAMGDAGTNIGGVASLVLAGLCLSGLLLWWPVGKWKWSYFLIEHRLGWKRRNYDLHRTVGLYCSAALLLISLSGAAMTFHDAVASGAQFVVGPTALTEDRPEIEFATTSTISADQAVAIAQREFPGWLVYRLYVPVPKSPFYRVFLNPADHFIARTQEARLEIHPQTGSIFHEESPRTRSTSDTMLHWILPLHFGTWGGLPMRWYYLVAAASPMVLIITGVALWWGRSLKRQLRTKQVQNSPQPVQGPALQ